MPAGHDISGGPAPALIKRLDADVSISNSTPAAVSGLTTATGLGTYVFNYYVLAQSSATSVGLKFSVNYTGTVTSFVANYSWMSGTSTASDDVIDQDHVAAAASVYSGFSARAKSTAGWGTLTDVDTQNADLLFVVEGLMIVSVAGNLELYHGSDSANATTVKAGTSLILFKTG